VRLLYHSALAIIKAFFFKRSLLVAENILLRQQLIIFKRSAKKPALKTSDRIIIAFIAKLYRNWKNALLIISPDTIIKWHRKGFRLYWNWKSRGKPGRTTIPEELKDLIRKMSSENPTWGAPRIRAELKLLGYTVALSTVTKYMNRKEKPPSQTWRTFLKNHAGQIAGIDFFNVVTINFKVLYCFFVLGHGSRKILHFNVTTNPGQTWTKLQIKQAFPYDTAPKYLFHDRATIFDAEFESYLKTLNIEGVRTGFQAPWENAYTERVIGTIRRECLDEIIILNENHLRKVIREFIDYYHTARTHQSLNDNAPFPRKIETPEKGKIKSVAFLGGLQHRYFRQAA
jgi:transposase InsO family protein